VGRFFAAAARLFRAAPWRVAADAQILALDAPAFGYANACLCIIGALGESLGVLVYRSMEDYLSLLRTAISGRSITGPGVVTFAVNFDRSSRVSQRLRQEAKAQAWPIERGGFPTVAHIDPDAVLRPLGDRDYAFAAATLEALLAFMAEHGSVFTGDDPAMPVQVRYEDGAGAGVRPGIAPQRGRGIPPEAEERSPNTVLRRVARRRRRPRESGTTAVPRVFASSD
jgi:hypothetical protein